MRATLFRSCEAQGKPCAMLNTDADGIRQLARRLLLDGTTHLSEIAARTGLRQYQLRQLATELRVSLLGRTRHRLPPLDLWQQALDLIQQRCLPLSEVAQRTGLQVWVLRRLSRGAGVKPASRSARVYRSPPMLWRTQQLLELALSNPTELPAVARHCEVSLQRVYQLVNKHVAALRRELAGVADAPGEPALC